MTDCPRPSRLSCLSILSCNPDIGLPVSNGTQPASMGLLSSRPLPPSCPFRIFPGLQDGTLQDHRASAGGGRYVDRVSKKITTRKRKETRDKNWDRTLHSVGVQALPNGPAQKKPPRRGRLSLGEIGIVASFDDTHMASAKHRY